MGTKVTAKKTKIWGIKSGYGDKGVLGQTSVPSPSVKIFDYNTKQPSLKIRPKKNK